jgi:methyl-accepting chemotaxis protein
MSYVQTGVASAKSAGEALTSIIHGSESVQKMVTQIAAAATEQSYSTQSVTTNVSEIASIIERTAASSQQSVEACQQLARLANELSSLVGSFKVGLPEDDRTANHTLGQAVSATLPLHGLNHAAAALSS